MGLYQTLEGQVFIITFSVAKVPRPQPKENKKTCPGFAKREKEKYEIFRACFMHAQKAFALDFLQLHVHTIPLALLYHVHAVTAKPNTN